MKAATFGQLVRELRKTTSDPQGNRWTRETLSKQIHLSVDQLGRLERGDRKYYDQQTLELLADTFKLSPIEQKELLIAAAGISDEERYHFANPDEQINDLLDVLNTMWPPAMLVDAFQNVVAINKPYQDLFMVTNDLIEYSRQNPINFNLLDVTYSNDLGIRDLLGPYWREIAIMQIHQFKRTTFHYQHLKYYKSLLNQLFKLPQFDIDWYSSYRSPFNKYQHYVKYSYEHPAYGPLNYIGAVTTNGTIYGELQLIVYTPTDFPTSDTFYQFAIAGDRKVTRLSEWPIKTNTPKS